MGLTMMLFRCILGVSFIVSISATVLDDLIPDKDFTEVSCNKDGECIQKDTVLIENTFWKEPGSGLKYHEPRLFYVDTQDLNAHCAKGIPRIQLANHLEPCENKPMGDICEFAKKGWLNKDGEPNSDKILETFSKVEGGEDLAKECLGIKPEDDYDYYNYEYDYYDYYYDNYDYKHRARRDLKGRRNRRAPALPNKRKGGNLAGQGPKPGPGKRSGSGKPAAVNGKGPNPGPGSRKFVQVKGKGAGAPPPKKPEFDVDAKLKEFGLNKKPGVIDLEKLVCLKKGVKDLINKCGKKILSNAP